MEHTAPAAIVPRIDWRVRGARRLAHAIASVNAIGTATTSACGARYTRLGSTNFIPNFTSGGNSISSVVANVSTRNTRSVRVVTLANATYPASRTHRPRHMR